MTSRSAARVKYAEYCRSVGRPLHVTDAEQDELRRHVARLYNRGMSFAGIGEACRVTETAVARILGDRVEHSHRDTYNAIMATSFTAPLGHRTGRRMDPTGMKRRLRALVALGFGYSIIGPELGVSPQAVYQLCVSSREVYSSTCGRVSLVYDKLQYADPMDYGSTRVGVSRAKGVARRGHYAPPSCWDPDTIDDPAATPDWTGSCGTAEGRRIHERDGIPVCDPCLWAPPEGRKFSPAKLRDLRVRRHLTLRRLAEMVGRDQATIRWWESGRSTPRHIDLLLSALDCTADDLFE